MVISYPRELPSVGISTPAKPWRLNRDRQRAVRDKIAIIMREADPTPFAAEGPCRAGIRASLCLQGWRWRVADDAAAELVAAALNRLGARRPTWQEGQPEWTQPGIAPVQYERCRNCFKVLPDGHYKYCCKECHNSYKLRFDVRWQDEEYRARKRALKAAWRERQETKRCERCGGPFKPGYKAQRFCSSWCVGKAYGFTPK